MSYNRKDILPGNPVCNYLREGSKNGKLGLVLEGGGMRGVTVAGMVLALEQLGWSDHFKYMYGASAGSITAAYFAANQATWGTSIFYDDLLKPDFFSWKRALKGEPPMDVDYLIKVVQEHKPLDMETALQKQISVFASDVNTGKLIYWNEFNNDLLGALRASATVPVVAGGPAKYRGGLYLDPGIHTSVPWKEALEDGCTHLIVLLSRPEDSPRPAASRLENLLAGNVFAKRYPELVPSYLRRTENYNEDLRELRKLESKGAPILTISPKRGLLPISSFENKRENLLMGARQGAEALYEKMFGRTPHFYELLVSSEKDGRPLWKDSPEPRRWKPW